MTWARGKVGPAAPLRKPPGNWCRQDCQRGCCLPVLWRASDRDRLWHSHYLLCHFCSRRISGGLIAPGIGISTEALFERASKLPRIELIRPPQVIGKNTVSSMQSGIYYGFVGQVDGIVAHMKKELGGNAVVVATGGSGAVDLRRRQAPSTTSTLS